MYNDLFTIGKVTIHAYGLFTALALLAALMLSTHIAKKRKMNEDICYGIVFYGVIFGYLCSKLTFVLVEWDSFIKNPIMFLSNSGFVVIGGLIGGVLTAIVYCRIKKEKFMDFFDICAPAIAIAQGFGRIGCFMAGCCYGRETDSWIGIAFHNSNYAPNGVKLIPTQLISSGLNFLNMAVLLVILSKVRKRGVTASLYVMFYSIGRFLIEFLRNDDRGNVGTLSTSQFFGVVLFAVSIIMLIISIKTEWKFGNKESDTASNESKEASADEK